MNTGSSNIEQRFSFGNNWLDFINGITEANITEAKVALQSFLGFADFSNLAFLDIGSGSGIHSLAARHLGAKVYAFDYDDESVLCTSELKDRFSPNDPDWIIEKGSILDKEYIKNLGGFDISYAWGVLHHTGALWQALYNSHLTVKPGGLLFIGIYNDQGIVSEIWRMIKAGYCSGPVGRIVLSMIFFPIFFLSGFFIDLLKFQNPIKRYHDHKKYRGMSLVTDWRDWLGGYPYEPASPKEIIGFFENLDYELVRFKKTAHGFGNNQFLFRKFEK